MAVEGHEQGAGDSGRVRFGPALSLSYDGADHSHRELVLPTLAEYGLPATFYVTELGLLEAPQAWQAAQNEGHEIACHSLYEAADPFGNLAKWTLESVEADLRAFRKLLAELFPRQRDCSFAYPGVEALCMASPYEQVPTPYRPVVDRLFSVARSAQEGLIDPSACDIGFLNCIDARDLSLDDLIVAGEAAKTEAKWAVFSFAGVGAGERAIDRQTHEDFCAWLAERQSWFRMGTVIELGTELREKRAAAEGTYSWSLAPSEEA